MIKPKFPEKIVSGVIAFPYAGGIAVPNCIASIPLFTLEEDPEKRLLLEDQYNTKIAAELQEAKEFYETLNDEQRWYGGRKDISMRISKFSIKEDRLFINLCASPENKQDAAKNGYKPLKSMKLQFEVFQSLVKNKSLKLV